MEHCLYRRLLSKDIRREKRKSLVNNLTASQVQLGKDLKSNRTAMAAIAAFTSSKKPNDEQHLSTEALTPTKSKISRWRQNKVHPSKDLKCDHGSKQSLNRSVSIDTQKSVGKSHVTLHSLTTSCCTSGGTWFDELGSDISAPSSIPSQRQSKWPSTREVLSSNPLYVDDASSLLSDMDSAVTNDHSM